MQNQTQMLRSHSSTLAFPTLPSVRICSSSQCIIRHSKLFLVCLLTCNIYICSQHLSQMPKLCSHQCLIKFSLTCLVAKSCRPRHFPNQFPHLLPGQPIILEPRISHSVHVRSISHQCLFPSSHPFFHKCLFCNLSTKAQRDVTVVLGHLLRRNRYHARQLNCLPSMFKIHSYGRPQV